MCCVKQTFRVAVAATIRWSNVVPPFGKSSTVAPNFVKRFHHIMITDTATPKVGSTQHKVFNIV